MRALLLEDTEKVHVDTKERVKDVVDVILIFLYVAAG
jgi:hypothetical protein